MQVLSRWRNIVIPATQSIRIPLTSNSQSFHSTDASFEKWKSKFNFTVEGHKQSPSKDYIRYSVRQKRSATKKTLKNLLFYQGCPSRMEMSFVKIDAENEDLLKNTSRTKPTRKDKGACHKKMKSKKTRKERMYEDFDEHERIFEEKYARQCFTRNFKPWRASGFDQFKFADEFFRRKTQYNEERVIIGAVSDRRVLGLPLDGPLKIEDVKAAFRSSALKWHPDKHQGSSQAAAEEKFKDCANAYNSLCSALSAA